MNVYESCPIFITPRFHIRLARMEDAPGLLKVYSDRGAHPYFNDDNCTSNFRYTTLKEMEDCLRMWQWSYEQGHFVRWTILYGEKPVGTVEMFRRDDGEDGRGSGVLRMDVASLYEFEDVFSELLEAMLIPMHEHFGCGEILTKTPRFAHQRQTALRDKGFVPARPLIGHDGRLLDGYWSHRA